MPHHSRIPFVPLRFVLASLALGCGGGGGGDAGTPPPTTAIAKPATNSGDAQNGSVGQALGNPLRVLVTEAGTPSSGVTVAWSTTATGGSVDPASGPTDANGIATTTWTLGTASGTQAAQATLTGASGSPVAFSATAAPGAAASLSKAGGDNQTSQVNTALGAPVQAKVADQFGNGVPGVDVDWAVQGGTPASATVATNGAGISLLNVTLGATAGTVIIVASATTLTGSPLSFNATASSAPPPTTTISVVNNAFTPSTLTVAAGTTVSWVWSPTAVDHNVFPDGNPEPTSSGALASAPHTYQFRFDHPGTFRYYCQNHGGPNGFGMSGTIIVQ